MHQSGAVGVTAEKRAASHGVSGYGGGGAHGSSGAATDDRGRVKGVPQQSLPPSAPTVHC